MSEVDLNLPSNANFDQKYNYDTSNAKVPTILSSRQAGKGEVTVTFEYSEPNQAYYHTVKALLNQYLDGEQQEELDVMSLADHICERASIG
jgi:L-amino acid N-acyltransferase YncA